MKSRAAKRRHARKKKYPGIFLKMRKTQEIEGKDNRNRVFRKFTDITHQ